EGEGWRVPASPIKAEHYRVSDPAEAAWAVARVTDQPFRSYEEPLRSTAQAARLPRTYIHCTRSNSIAPAMRERARGEGWRFRELDTGHSAMLSAPEATAELLLEAAR